MASVGPNNPTAASDLGTPGTQTWSNPTYVYSSNDSRARVTSNVDDTWRYSTPLVVNAFGLSIPTGATIDGILVEMERRRTGGGNSRDYVVSLSKDGSTAVGDNKGDTATNLPTSDTYKSYGGSSDLWGTTWSESEIESSNFSVYIRAQLYKLSSIGQPYYELDHVRVTVYYTEASSGYTHSVTGVAAASISAVDGVATASISTVQGA